MAQFPKAEADVIALAQSIALGSLQNFHYEVLWGKTRTLLPGHRRLRQ